LTSVARLTGRPLVVRAGVPVLAGALNVAAFAPFGAFPLSFLTLALLFHWWRSAPSAGAAAQAGFWYGCGFFLCGVSWVYVSLHDFGAMPAVLAAAATLAFCLYLACYVMVAGYAVARLLPPGPWRLAATPPAWVLCEWLRSLPFNGFPWIDLGYSQIDTPLAGYAPLFGVYGMSLITASVAACLAALAGARALGRARLLVGVFIVFIAGGALRLHAWTVAAGSGVDVALAQGNIPEEMKFIPGRFEQTLESYARLIERSSARLVVLPETAIPRFYSDVDPAFWERLKADAARRGGDILLGVPTGALDRQYYNSVVSFGVSPTQTYSKTHLVPLGEYVPLGFNWIVAWLNIPLSNFTAGPPGQRPLRVAGERVAVNICYEDVFGSEIARQLPEATLLVNASNVAWFGRSLAPAQHLQMSRLRAIETGRDLLRSTNTGMTAIVRRDGEAVVLPPFTEGVLTGHVQGYTGATPYVRWADLPALAFAVLAWLSAVAGPRLFRR
jgi:apolipoprotein N-acyltransferase